MIPGRGRVGKCLLIRTVAKVGEHQAFYGGAWEETLDIAAKVAGAERDFTAAEIRWKDPRQLNPGVIADMGSTKRAMGYPLTLVAEDMGESPQRINRLRAEAAVPVGLCRPHIAQQARGASNAAARAYRRACPAAGGKRIRRWVSGTDTPGVSIAEAQQKKP